MSCPSCQRPSRDFTNSSGLVTRCDDVWHRPNEVVEPCLDCGTTEAAIVVRNERGVVCFDVYACAARKRGFLGKHPGCDYLAFGFCDKCGQVVSPDPAESPQTARPEDFMTKPDESTAPPPPTHSGAAKTVADASVYSHPYTTPIPTGHDGSTGWIWCATCESPQPVSGHECAPRTPDTSEEVARYAVEMRDRAELAEGLVNRLAFIHGGDHMEPDIYDDARAVAARQGNYGGWTWPLHAPGECVFCDAARGGGR